MMQMIARRNSGRTIANKTELQSSKILAPAGASLHLLLFNLMIAVLFLAPLGECICYGISMWISQQPTKLDQRYLINGSALDIYFNFDWSPKTGGDCATLVPAYSVSVDGGLMPPWMQYFYNGGSPFIRVQTSNTGYEGIYTAVITGSVSTLPVTYAGNTLTISVSLSSDPCVLTRLLDPGIADITYMIDSHSPPSIRDWAEFIDVQGDTDTPSGLNCGPRKYDWPEQYDAFPPISDYFIFDGPARRITVETTDP